MSDSSRTQERRGEARHTVAWRGRVKTARGDVPCDVQDVCCNGVRISTATPLEPGSEVSLHVDHLGGFSGTVVWRQGDRYGVKFASPSTLIWHFLGAWTSPEGKSRGRQI